MSELLGSDAYTPQQMAERVRAVGVKKAQLPLLTQALLRNGLLVGRTAMGIALAKAQLPWGEAFFRGVLCHVLLCMAVWMGFAGRSVVDKAVAIVFPATAFVAAGFEHSVAKLYFFPLAWLQGAPITAAQAAGNLLPVVAGKLVGGSVLVALVYWIICLRPAIRPPAS